ncbi:hypothetical protein QJQ45_026531 [Haematococcus lacustris]|nr:hypothetical protein QJQ45_026531 [Haematococcus lacustris]
MTEASGWMSTAVWLVIALAVKGGAFFITQFILYKRSGGSVRKLDVKLRIVQSGSNRASASKVLVTGGCGFLGRHIVELLSDLFKDQLNIYVLDMAAQPNPSLPHVTYIAGDIRVPAHVTMASAGAAAIIHTAGLMQYATTDEPFMTAVNVDGTRNVVEACLDKEVKVLVYTSSVAVLWSKDGRPIHRAPETSPALPPDQQLLAYGAAKAVAERLVLGVNNHITRSVVLRAGGLYGPGDQHLVDSAHAFTPLVGQDNQARVPLVWVRDAARAHVLALVRLLWPGDSLALQRASRPWRHAASKSALEGPAETNGAATSTSVASAVDEAGRRERLAGAVCHLCHDPDRDLPTYRVFMGAADAESPGGRLSCWGTQPQWSVPRWLAFLVADLNEAVASRLGFAPFHRALTRATIVTATRDATVDIAKAKLLLGWEPTPWRDAVAAVREELLSRERAELAVAPGVDGQDKKEL